MGNKKQSTPLLFKIPKTVISSFTLQMEEASMFYPVMHYHPELQITLIKRGTGAYFIGETVGQFSSGDIFIIGPNTPHIFRNDPIPVNNERGTVSSLSIYFNKEAFGEKLFDLPETIAIANFIEKSTYGFIVEKSSQYEASIQIENIFKLQGFDRLIELFHFLNKLTETYKLRVISKNLLTASLNDQENQRLNDVFDFLAKNYHKNITLKSVADVANMSPTGFCRYFMRRTRKTYTEFLNEIRIGYACRKLATTDKSISEIAFECGFNNLSHFNRQFQRNVKKTPSDYRIMQLNINLE